MSRDLYWAHLLVDEEPYCVWDWELPLEVGRFLNGLDPGYFQFVSEAMSAALENDSDRQRAAVGLRLTYSHALESFFALLMASMQATNAPMAWLLKYRPRQIKDVVRKFAEGRPPLNQPRINGSWGSVSEEIHRYVKLDDPELERGIKEGFAGCWARFAYDFLDPSFNGEYNSIKHGFRIQAGGFTLALGLEEEPGVPAPDEAMRIYSESDYGTSYFKTKNLSNRHNFGLVTAARNWNPDGLAVGIQLLVVSIGNVICYLKTENHVAGDVRYEWPHDLAGFDLPWETDFSIASMEGGLEITADDIDPHDPEQILRSFRPAENGEDSSGV